MNKYMEPEEYEVYLQEQAKEMEKIKAYHESLKDNNSGPTLYELNKQILSQKPALDADEIQNNAQKVLDYLNKYPAYYYLFLCNELKYYTVFHFWSGDPDNLVQDFLSIIKDLGEVRLIEEDTNGAIAVWSSFVPERFGNELHCFYFFPYDKGVIET